jgi:hypothetical protein
LRPQLVSYFIDAEIKWTADGGYHHGVMPATVARRWRATAILAATDVAGTYG